MAIKLYLMKDEDISILNYYNILARNFGKHFISVIIIMAIELYLMKDEDISILNYYNILARNFGKHFFIIK